MPRLKNKSLPSPIPEKLRSEPWIGLVIGVGGKRANRAWGLDAYADLAQRLLEDPRISVLLMAEAIALYVLFTWLERRVVTWGPRA